MAKRIITRSKARKSSAASTVIDERAFEIRELIFQAQAILNVVVAAERSERPADDWSTHNTLGTASKLLDNAAERLEPGVITEVASPCLTQPLSAQGQS